MRHISTMIKMRSMTKVAIAVIVLLDIDLLVTEAVSSRALRNAKWMKFEDDSPLIPLERQKRFFTFFTMVSYPNEQCRYDAYRNGTCMQSTECHASGGTSRAGGICGRMQGTVMAVCCLLQKSCGESVSKRNNTYFVNPDYPDNTTAPRRCDLIVPTRGYCFVRLDFFNFTIYPPVQGSCVADQFLVPELSQTVPMLCGYNNNTHLYLDVRGLAQITLRVNLGEWQGHRRWLINIARINCGSKETPPLGCLQYFPESFGFVRSFNYNEESPSNSSLIAGLDYTVCVRRGSQRCYTRWSSNFFSLSSTNNGTSTAVVGDRCGMNSKVIIPEGYDISARNVTFDRFCGDVLSAQPGSRNSTNIYTSSTPFQVRVHTARRGIPQTLGSGFELRYQQLQCLDAPLAGILRRERL